MNSTPTPLPALSATEIVAPHASGLLSAPRTSLEHAAKEFEGLLVRQLLQSLRKTVEPSGLLSDSGGARGTYEYLFDQAVVDQSMASGRTLGLAEKLVKAWREQKSSSGPARCVGYPKASVS